mgnify:CR=1 FL=1
MLNYSQLTVDFDHCGLSFGGVRRLAIIKAVASAISILLNFSAYLMVVYVWNGVITIATKRVTPAQTAER